MAASRGSWHSHQTPPPPPYEANYLEHSSQAARGSHFSDTNEDYAHHSSNQTIPKTAASYSSSGERNLNRMISTTNTGRTHDNSKIVQSNRHQVNKFNESQTTSQHQTMTNSHHRKQSSSGLSTARRNNVHDQFVRSLEAPKSFLGHISIEPFAFLAIVALYIEFPAIQDLIWTKICLEVMAEHPAISQSVRYAAPNALTNSSSLLHETPSNSTTSSTKAVDANSTLSSDGRIIQQVSTNDTSTYQVVVPHGNSTNHESLRRQQHLLCDRLNRRSVPVEIRQQIVDIDSLFWLKYQILICSLCLLASPYWGGMSDKIGRIIPMNVPVISSILCNTISLTFSLLISLDSHSLFHIEWLYLGAVIVGLSGGQTVLIMNMFSFISDNTTSEERSRRVTVLESVIFVAHSLGFFLNKMIMLLGLDPPNRPWLNRHCVAFGSCILLNAIGCLYSMARMRHYKFHRFLNNFDREQQEAAIIGASPSLSSQLGGPGGAERGTSMGDLMASGGSQLGNCGERLRELTSSTPDDPDGPIARSDKSNWNFWDTMITFRYYKETYEVATKRRDTRLIILLLLLSGFISALSLAVQMSLFFIYVKMDPFNWTSSQYSLWNSYSAITRGIALVSLTLLMRFSTRWNVPDPIVAATGFLAKGAGLLTIGLAHTSSHLNWSLLALTFSEYSMPPIRSLLSKLVVREELGKIYSCLGVMQSFCFILGNIAFYVAFTTYTDQNLFRLSFLVVAGIEFGAVILVLIIYTAIRGQIPRILS